MSFDLYIVVYLIKFLLDFYIIGLYFYYKLYVFDSIVNFFLMSSIVPVTLVSLILYETEDNILYFLVSFSLYPFLFFAYTLCIKNRVDFYNLHVSYDFAPIMPTNIQNIPVAKLVGIADMQINDGLVYTSEVAIVE